MTLIGICGGTGSGKSTLANKIESHFKSIGVVKILSDSYYKNNYTLNFKDRSKINYDHPNSIDFELLIDNLKSLKNNKKINEPIYSYKTHKRLKKSKLIFSKKIIIVEGLHILCDKRIINLIDYSIYLDVSEETRLQRRIRRDVEFRGRSINEVEQRYFYMCKPMHDKFINPSKKHADVILKSRSVSLKSILNLISKKIKC